MPAALVYQTDVINEFYKRNYKPAVIHHPEVQLPVDEHGPIVHHHHVPQEMPSDRGKAILALGLGLVLLGLTAYEEEE